MDLLKAFPDAAYVRTLVAAALKEDMGEEGDITTDAIFSKKEVVKAKLLTKEAGVIAGQKVAELAFTLLDPGVLYRCVKQEGATVAPDEIVAEVSGPARSILSGERTALNFLGRLSGIATLTAEYVARVSAFDVRLLDTRKTTPGLRLLEKYAVRAGGGCNHRMGLFDMVLVKENHIRACGSICEAVRRCRESLGERSIKIEVETSSFDEVKEALGVAVDRIMLDNMTPSAMQKCVEYVKGRVELEASGNVSLSKIADIAATGVDYISVGALTHSAPSLDLSLLFEHDA